MPGGKIIILCSFLLLNFYFLIPPAAAQENSLPQPYLLFPTAGNYQTPSSLPLITGETQNDTAIDVYIDNKLAGQAEVISGPLFTAYFTYRPTKNLRSGEHQIYVVAKDKNNPALNAMAEKTKLYIIPFPSPTLFRISRYTNDQPLIQGVAKNDSLIKIYADNQLQTSFKVVNHPSGTAAFNWLAPADAAKAKFYATATDKEGKESFDSNFIFEGQPAPKITPTAQPAGETAKKENENVKITDETKKSEAEKETTITDAETTEKGKTYQIWLGIILVAIIVIIIFWMRRGFKKEESGEITAGPAEAPAEKKPEPQQVSIFPAIQQEPLIKTPDQPTPTPPTMPEENKQETPPQSL